MLIGGKSAEAAVPKLLARGPRSVRLLTVAMPKAIGETVRLSAENQRKCLRSNWLTLITLPEAHIASLTDDLDSIFATTVEMLPETAPRKYLRIVFTIFQFP